MGLKKDYKEDLRILRDKPAWIFFVVLVSFFLLIPKFSSDFFVYILTLISVYSIGVIGQNILIGYTGQISLGQAGFLAIGAYTFAHLSNFGSPFFLSVLLSGISSAIFGILVSIPSLRLKGPYLAIATLGFGICIYQVFSNFDFISGGRMGLSIPPLSLLGHTLSSTEIYYLFFFISMGFVFMSYNLINSYVGRAFISIRDGEVAAEIQGVNLTKYKVLSFVISSFYTGVHGALYAQLIGYLEPQMFTFFESITILAAIVVGGIGTVAGSIFGSGFVVLVPQILSGFRELIPVVYGVLIIFVMIFEPLGLYGRWLKIKLYFMNWPFR